MASEFQPLQGECRCGRVRFRVTAPPLLTMACHCTGCQRMTASAFSLTVAVPGDGFSVTQGEPVIGGLRGSPLHFFCEYCMSWLFTRMEGVDMFVNVRTSMLDDPRPFPPFIETYTSEKLPWVTTPAVHSYPQFPPFEEYENLVMEYAAYVGRSAR
jgi:hypothetical protein